MKKGLKTTEVGLQFTAQTHTHTHACTDEHDKFQIVEMRGFPPGVVNMFPPVSSVVIKPDSLACLKYHIQEGETMSGNSNHSSAPRDVNMND